MIFLKKNSLYAGVITMLILCALLSFTGCGPQEQALSAEQALIGDWQIENGEGENHALFTYSFKDTGRVYLEMDNVAMGGDYTLGKSDEGKDTFTTKMYYNLNGTYEFEFADNNNTMYLTDNSGGKMTMKRVDETNLVPDPPENPVIDSRLTGNWKSKEDGGITYTFNENGLMTSNTYDVMIINAQYSAQNGEINLKYKQGTTVEDSYAYSFDGDVLTIDGVEFIKDMG